MDENKQNNLKPLCTENNVVHETYYGRIHRAQFKVGGEVKAWDIMHIEIPFNPQKEAELMRRFGLERDDLGEFYKHFSQAVINHVRVNKAALLKDENGQVAKSVVRYNAVRTFKRFDKEGHPEGTDIYFISEPMEPFTKSDMFALDKLTVKSIDQIALRLMQTLKTMNDRGLTLGGIDLDSYYLVDDPASGKKFLKAGYFFYGSADGLGADEYTQDIAPFISENIASNTNAQNRQSDMYMLCKLLWGLYSGCHYTVPGDLSKAPVYASQEISDALYAGLTYDEGAYKRLNAAIRAHIKQIESGALEDKSVEVERPYYLDLPLPELRYVEPEETPDEQTDADQDETKKKRKPRKGSFIFLGIVLIALAAALYSPIKYLVESRRNMPEQPANTEIEKDDSMSSKSDLYILNGTVVNSSGMPVSVCELDGDGNIVYLAAVGYEDNRAILYDKDHCVDYVVADDCKPSFTQTYFGVDEEDYLILKEGVADLRGEKLKFKGDGQTTEISAKLIDKYKIDESTNILLKDSKGNDVIAFVRKVDATASDKSAHYFAMENENVTLRDLMRVKGEWWYDVFLTVSPKDVTNKKFKLTTDDENALVFAVPDGEEYLLSRALNVTVNKSGRAEFTVLGMLEGRFTFTVESDDGLYKKKFALTFEPDMEALPAENQSETEEPGEDEQPAVTEEPVQPTETPAVVIETMPPTDTPVPAETTTPVETPKPTPTPWPTQRPVETIVITPTPAPAQTQTPVNPPAPSSTPYQPVETEFEPTFTIDKKKVSLAIGEETTLYPSESFIVKKIDPLDVIDAQNTNGVLTVKGLKAGTCKITLSCTHVDLLGKELTITITVKK